MLDILGRWWAVGALVAFGPILPARAQAVPGSQHGEVMQRVGFTDIAISYNRPVARGRVLFGDEGVVRWGRIWNPGADSATRIGFSRDVRVEGREIPAGEYSVWLIPGPEGPWTLILSRAAHVFHTQYPGEEHDALRTPITPERGEHMEVLAFYFPIVARDSTVLRMHWGETVVPIRIVAGGAAGGPSSGVGAAGGSGLQDVPRQGLGSRSVARGLRPARLTRVVPAASFGGRSGL